MTLKASLKHWMQRVWVEQDSDAITELMSEHASVQGLEETLLEGRDAFQQFHKLITSQLKDIEIEFVQVVEEGEWVSAVFKISASHVRTGTRTKVHGHTMNHIVDGQIVRGYNLIDFVKHFEQLGVLPQRTLDLCWLGQRPQFKWEAVVKRMN